jgi:hypothetical protein
MRQVGATSADVIARVIGGLRRATWWERSTMVSGLAWLDSSRADQQRMREMLKMFSEQESRDELGIGQVRDAFSDLLFPGTSVLHTRARYLLIVPWCHVDAERRGLRGDRLAARVADNERRVIKALRNTSDAEGLIGRRAGPAVKTLPSAIYGTALARYGVRTGDSVGPATQESLDVPELTHRTTSAWHPTLPEPPAGFPSTVDGGFVLTAAEASWIRERILTSAPHTLLAHLLTTDDDPSPSSQAPWDDAAATGAPEPTATILRHARLFSRCMHGAALLYNLLIAERYEAAGLSEIDEPVSFYRDELAKWASKLAAEPDLSRWDRGDMWSRVIEQNPRIAGNALARRFVDAWLDAVRAGVAADDDALRTLVAERERLVKRAQSRLINDKLLRAWNGASGSASLVYRWPQVRRELVDIRAGLEVTDAAA